MARESDTGERTRHSSKVVRESGTEPERVSGLREFVSEGNKWWKEVLNSRIGESKTREGNSSEREFEFTGPTPEDLVSLGGTDPTLWIEEEIVSWFEGTASSIAKVTAEAGSARGEEETGGMTTTKGRTDAQGEEGPGAEDNKKTESTMLLKNWRYLGAGTEES